ncbi:benzoate/H(+) symporter BenE family transporter [Legionella dresdenensis]|uniref:Benzoate/H(+) symporter BenE family transporter n=1 Tax=Legionella dresdenensis TaxID=450200 RepID=A0ABV8CHP9_9GAMM
MVKQCYSSPEPGTTAIRYLSLLASTCKNRFIMSKYFSIANITAGFIAVMVGFTSSAVIIFQAAAAAGATSAQVSSWLLALGVGVAFGCFFVSLYYRMPILVAWSTPGAALLVASLSGVSLPQAIGAFILSALLVVIAGATGCFARLMAHIPRSLASAMLAGILLNFGLNVFVAMQDQMLLICLMLITYLIGKRLFPRLAILMVLIVGTSIACSQNLVHIPDFHLSFAYPILVKPEFSWQVLISVGVPLFIVTMTSQMVPGFAVLHSAGYYPPVSPLVTLLGFINLLIAPFGGFSVNLAAMTAAICTSEHAEADPSRRYRATIWAGVFYLLIGIFSASLVSILTAFPKELIAGIAGIALLGTLGANLKVAVDDESQREPALITFLVSASGVNLFGVSAAFWGLLAGIIAAFFLGSLSRQLAGAPTN